MPPNCFNSFVPNVNSSFARRPLRALPIRNPIKPKVRRKPKVHGTKACGRHLDINEEPINYKHVQGEAKLLIITPWTRSLDKNAHIKKPEMN
jgi:hypothetical protein